MHLLSTSVCVCLCVYVCVHLSRFSSVQLFVTPWTITHQPPLSMGVSKQEYWSGFPCTSSEDLPNPGIKPTSLLSPALAGEFFTANVTWEAPTQYLFLFQKEHLHFTLHYFLEGVKMNQ